MRTERNTFSNGLKMSVLLVGFVFGIGQAGYGAGVTIVTHGFNDNATNGWIPAMVNAIINRDFSGDSQNVSVYQVFVTFNGSQELMVSHSALIGGNPLTTSSGEIFIELDWSTLTAGGFSLLPGKFYSTTNIAKAVASKLTDPNFISELGGRSLSFLPIHIIGHSRGGSLACEISRLLGQQGIWVDQLTTLDPHPVELVLDGGVLDSDGPANVYENVLYADNYYQNLEFPSGVYMDGANYRILTSLSGGYPVDSPVDYSDHLDVHFWYHGTIDISPSASDGTATFNAAMRNAWYASWEYGGQFAGFYYSRLGGGLTDDEGPYFGLYDEGDFNNSPDNRAPLTRNPNEWPNLIQLAHDGTGLVAAGNAFPIKYVFQSFDSSSVVQLYLDPDQNAFNGNQIALTLTPDPNPQSSTARGTRTINAGAIVPASIPPGLYYVYGMITNPNGTRYLYSLNHILVTANTGGGNTSMITTVSPSSFTGLPIGQRFPIRIIGSGFTGGSTLVFNDGFQNYNSDPAYLTFVSANEIDYNISTGTNQANWTVQVVNGAQTSTPAHFSVNAPSAPPTATGSLVVNLSPVGAISSGAQWEVDGTGYNSSGQVVGYLTPGKHTVSFKPISGYTTPANQTVIITANMQTAATGTYYVVAPSTYTLTLNQPSTGNATPSPVGTWNGSAYVYNAGSVVKLTANPNPGYHFLNWAGDVTGPANPVTITISGNMTVTPNFAAGDPNMGSVTVTIQPAEAVTAGVTWGFNDTDFRASGTSYSTYPETAFAYLHGVNGWTGVGGWVTFVAGQTSNYVFTASYTNGSIIGNDPRTYYTLAGSVGIFGFTNATGTAAQFSEPWSVAVDSANNIFVVDSGNNVIRKIDNVGNVTTFAGTAGSPGSNDGLGTNALFNHPLGVAVDISNNVYVADFNNNTIRKITPDGTVSTLAGLAGSSGSTNATGNAARFNGPAAVTADTNGNVYVADNYNCTIRKITPAGTVSTLAGSPLAYGSVDATGSAARFNYPSGVAVDGMGNVYVADTFNSTIRKVTSDGAVTTLAGSAQSSGAADGTGTSAVFSYPNGVAVDPAGNVYVADTGNHSIRKVTPSGIVSTLAGLSSQAGTNNGVGSAVRFRYPDGLTLDSTGNIYIADGGNSTIVATLPLAAKIDQFISFAPLPDKSANDVPFSISATSSSGLPVYLNVLSGPAVMDTNNVLTLLGGGTVNVIAWQPGNSNYNAAEPVLQSFNVSKIPQTITFGVLSQQKVGDAPFSLYATSDSGLPVNFSVSGPAVLDGDILTLTGWGTVTITASQSGNASFMAAANVVQMFFIIPPDNTIVGSQILSNGDFQLAFYGLNGSNYLIQTSTNLLDWQPFTNFTGTNFLLFFSDSTATNFNQRFYRVRMQ